MMMNQKSSVIVVAIVVILLSLSVCVSGRRHRYSNVVLYKKYMEQSTNLMEILGSLELSLFNIDIIDVERGAYNADICPYMDKHMTMNDSIHPQALDEFAMEYMKEIYNENNFPFTYRPTAYLNTSNVRFEEYVHCFYKRFCSKKKQTQNSEGVYTLFSILIALLFGFIYLHN